MTIEDLMAIIEEGSLTPQPQFDIQATLRHEPDRLVRITPGIHEVDLKSPEEFGDKFGDLEDSDVFPKARSSSAPKCETEVRDVANILWVFVQPAFRPEDISVLPVDRLVAVNCPGIASNDGTSRNKFSTDLETCRRNFAWEHLTNGRVKPEAFFNVSL